MLGARDTVLVEEDDAAGHPIRRLTRAGQISLTPAIQPLRRITKDARRRGTSRPGTATANRQSIPKIAVAALAVGALSGFLGHVGKFLIVPALLFATGMSMLFTVGSSLLAVGALGLTTAANYALSGLRNRPVAAEYIIGGFLDGRIGMRVPVGFPAERRR